MIGVILLQIVLIFINAVCASAEIAVVSTNEMRIDKMAEKGHKGAKKLKKLIESPSKFLSTIQVVITLAGFIGSAFAADTFSEPLVAWLIGIGLSINATVLHSVCVVFITLILAYFNIVLGELIPKRLAMKNPEKTALGVAGFLRFISVVFSPVVWLLTVSTNGLLRLIGINPNESDEQVTEEEIIMMAETGTEQGLIKDEESELIKNIFEFKEQTVGESCTHRKDADILLLSEDDDTWAKKIKETHHTYYPVCENDIDNIIGVLNTKDYFRLDTSERSTVLNKAVCKPLFVTENMPSNTLLTKMRSTRDYFAIVIDEYGGVKGIITLHDLIELIVGDIDEKGDVDEYSISKIEENKWLVRGLAPFDEVWEALNKDFPEEENDFETFSGYILNRAGKLPSEMTGVEFSSDGLKIKVLEVKSHCIEKAEIEIILPEEEN